MAATKKKKKKTRKEQVLVRMWRNWCIAGGSVKCHSHCGKQFNSPQKVKHRVTIWPETPFLSISPKRV
jgi:hypothetical protein